MVLHCIPLMLQATGKWGLTLLHYVRTDFLAHWKERLVLEE